MSTDRILSFTVNGEPARLLVEPAQTLLEVLRGPLRLTGTKHGCDVGDCGACTVLVDGVPRLSCITLAVGCEGARVETIEGVATPAGPDPIQEAFDHHVAAQCGYCTPGFVMTLRHLFTENPSANEAELREALGSNLCRCTGYTKILTAAREAQAAYAGKS